jgi:excisionase family DNA binding protein
MRRILPDLLTLTEVADLLKLSDRTVYDMCRRGRLPGVSKVAGQWRIDRRKLLAWLDAGGEFEQDLGD